MQSSYRRSIWKQDERYRVSTKLTANAIKTISILQSVEAAKKRVPPIPIEGLLRIERAATALPRARNITSDCLKGALLDCVGWGCGPKTLICMFSVLLSGSIPPLDRKIASTSRRNRWIDSRQEKALNGSDIERLSVVYVSHLLPQWIAARKRGMDPKSIDAEWGAEAPKSAKAKVTARKKKL